MIFLIGNNIIITNIHNLFIFEIPILFCYYHIFISAVFYDLNTIDKSLLKYKHLLLKTCVKLMLLGL